jgi:hypothetical protein
MFKEPRLLREVEEVMLPVSVVVLLSRALSFVEGRFSEGFVVSPRPVFLFSPLFGVDVRVDAVELEFLSVGCCCWKEKKEEDVLSVNKGTTETMTKKKEGEGTLALLFGEAVSLASLLSLPWGRPLTGVTGRTGAGT